MKRLSEFINRTNEDFETLPVITEPDDKNITDFESHSNIVRELIDCYCEEIDCWYRYFLTSKFMYGTPDRESLEKLFEENGKDELEDHAVKLLNRLDQLGWSPVHMLNIDKVMTYGTHRTWFPQLTTKNLAVEMFQDEELAIKHYKKVEELTRNCDPVTNTLIKEILIDEEEHRQNLKNYIDDCTAQ